MPGDEIVHPITLYYHTIKKLLLKTGRMHLILLQLVKKRKKTK